MRKGFAPILILLVVVIVAGGGFWFYNSYIKEKFPPFCCPLPPSSTPAVNEVPSSSLSPKKGNFKLTFSYPAEGTPVVRLCFEAANNIEKEYCFFKAKGIGSTIESQGSGFVDSGELPVGNYYAYIIVYWENQPATVINLNKCSYKITDYNQQKTTCPNYKQDDPSINKNVHFGGEREMFVIEEGKDLDMGLIYLTL